MDLDAIEAALSKMTPGPWKLDRRASAHVNGPNGRGVASASGYHNNMDDGVADENTANAAGIALLRNNADVMIAEIRRLREMCGEAADTIECYESGSRPEVMNYSQIDELRAASKGDS